MPIKVKPQLRSIPKPEDIAQSPLSAYGSEFQGISDWTVRGTAPSIQTALDIPGMRLKFNTVGDAIYKACPSGDFEVMAIAQQYTSYGGMLGISILNSVGTGIGISPYNNGYVYAMWNITTWAYNSTAQSGISIPNQLDSSSTYQIAKHYMILRKSGTAYTARFSWDGLIWTSYSTGTTSAITPAYLAIGYWFLGTGAPATFDILRVNTYSPTYTP